MLGVCALFIPASTPRMINAGFSLYPSSIIFDLEDAVSIDEKDSARQVLQNVLPIFRDRNIAVRINSSDACWKEDIELVKTGIVNTLVVPKARAEFIRELSAVLDSWEIPTQIAALIESTESLEELSQIAISSKRVCSLLMGGEDYSLDLGVERTPEGTEIQYARAKLANIAAARHIEALDTPFVNVEDMEALKKDSEYAKSLGFTGKLAINPLQIDTIKQVFLPSEQDIEWAKMVIEAVGKPENKGKGAFSLKGKMVDLPVIKRAERTLEKAKMA